MIIFFCYNGHWATISVLGLQGELKSVFKHRCDMNHIKFPHGISLIFTLSVGEAWATCPSTPSQGTCTVDRPSSTLLLWINTLYHSSHTCYFPRQWLVLLTWEDGNSEIVWCHRNNTSEFLCYYLNAPLYKWKVSQMVLTDDVLIFYSP